MKTTNVTKKKKKKKKKKKIKTKNKKKKKKKKPAFSIVDLDPIALILLYKRVKAILSKSTGQVHFCFRCV